MKAMILCAGLGTRLRPLTERWPKPAIPFLGQPLLRMNLAILSRAGVRAVGINTHHLPEVMVAVAKDECARAGMALEVVHEPVIQGTAGGIRGLRSFLDTDPFVVLNGDILFALDLKAALDAHQRSGSLATLVTLPMPAGAKYNAIEVDATGSVRKLAGLGPGGPGLSPWHFSGVHVMSQRVFKYFADDGPEDSVRDVYPRALAAGERVGTYVANGYWSDLGTPSRFLATVRDVLRGNVDATAFPGVWPLSLATRASFGLWMRHGSRVDPQSVAGPALVDEGANVAQGARLGEGVYVGHNARVDAGARLNRAVVFDETSIAAGEELVEVIAWGSHRIPAPLGE